MTESDALKQAATQLDGLAEQMLKATTARNREDLATRLSSARTPLHNPWIEVAVVGQFKKGKSALVNALIGAPVCPVDDLVATSVPTLVRYGDTLQAALVTHLPGEPRPIRTRVDPARLREHVTERASESGILGRLHAEVTIPRPLLTRGLVLVDTPGVGASQNHMYSTITLLPQADAALVVTDATQELTAPEMNLMRQAHTLCPRVTCVVSKTDLQREWRTIARTNAEHLAAARLKSPIFATSSLLHRVSIEENDPLLRQESGIDALATHLGNSVRESVLRGRQRSFVSELHSVGQHLAMAVQAELDALEEPGGASDTVSGLQRAEDAAARLTRRTARWQQTLSDGTADLLGDIEFDLRDRLRAVGREAEELIGASDPGEVWDEIGSWLAESITQAVSDNFVWAHERSTHLAETVALHFSLDGTAAVPHLSVTGAREALESIGGLDTVSTGKLSLGQKLMIGLKGSYGGVLMFGLMTTLAGMALVNPLSVAAGIIMGGFAYKQDASQRLEHRRAEAKQAVRKLVDESIFQVGKASRDRMSRIKRLLRDHFVGVAEELRASLEDSVRSAQHGAQVPHAQQEARTAQLRQELQHLHGLIQRAERIVAEAPAPERRTA